MKSSFLEAAKPQNFISPSLRFRVGFCSSSHPPRDRFQHEPNRAPFAITPRFVCLKRRRCFAFGEIPRRHQRRPEALRHLRPNPRHTLHIGFRLVARLDVYQTGRTKHGGQFIGNRVRPSVGLAPLQERFKETPELRPRRRIPTMLGVIVVKHHHPSPRLDRGAQLVKSRLRRGDPLQHPRRRRHIETLRRLIVAQLRLFELQVGKIGKRRASLFEQNGIAVDTYHLPQFAHPAGDSSRNRTRATACVEHTHAWRKQFRQTAVVPLKRAFIQNVRI